MMARSIWTEKGISLLVLAVAAIAYLFFVSDLRHQPRAKMSESVNVAIPPLLQVVLAGGDKYLAADIATLRATVVTWEGLDDVSYRVLAQIHDDIARLNPAHEDNYYLAQAILPWAGHVRVTLDILSRAAAARPWDMLPLFLKGFDYMYFLKDYTAAGEAFRAAADRAQGKNREALLNLSAKFYEKGDDPRFAIGVIKGIADGTRNPAQRHFLMLRVKRLEGLIDLRTAAEKYSRKFGRPISALPELVSSGILDRLPEDPLGLGYTLDQNHMPVLVTKGLPSSR